MKISLNLAPVPSARDRYALAWSFPVVLISILGLVFLVRTGSGSFRELRQYRQALEQVQRQDAELQNQVKELKASFNGSEFMGIVQKAHFVNDLIQQRQVTMTELTARVSELLPPMVHVDGITLSHPGGYSEVRFTVVARNEESVEKFLVNLEQSPNFANVAILSSNLDSKSGGASVVLGARYVEAAR